MTKELIADWPLRIKFVDDTSALQSYQEIPSAYLIMW
jgi:hypothetical protein